MADVGAALFNSALICGTMLPLSIYTAKILLQTAPEQILPLLDKSLREVCVWEWEWKLIIMVLSSAAGVHPRWSLGD